MAFDLRGVAFTDKSQIPTVLYRLNNFVPTRDAKGSIIMIVMPHWDNDPKKIELFGPPPPTDKRLVLLHPDNYPTLVIMAVECNVALMEWRVGLDKAKEDEAEGK